MPRPRRTRESEGNISSLGRGRPVVILIARLNFPEEKLVPVAVVLFILVNVVVTLP